MSESTLKTQTISFKNVYKDETPTSLLKLETPPKFLATNNVKAIQITNESNLKLKHVLKSAQENKQNKLHRKSKLELANPYFAYIPKFYLNELRLAKGLYIFFLSLFLVFVAASGTLIYLTLTKWKEVINPYILLLLIFPFVIFLLEFLVHWIKYRNFRNEAETINFRDQKLLTVNVQKLYKNLRTAFVDINWICITAYVLIGLTILVDAIAVMFKGYSFGDFNAAMYVGDLTYSIVFWSCAGAGILIFLIHAITIFSNYLRAANIENFYKFQIVDQDEINKIKKHKNYRDAIIFFVVVGSFIFITWMIIKIVSSKLGGKKTTVVVK